MSPVIRTLIFTILVPGFWTVAMPYWLLPRGARPSLSGVGAAGWLLIAAGIALYFACAFWGFAVRGQGTPLPMDPPQRLVVGDRTVWCGIPCIGALPPSCWARQRSSTRLCSWS